jgi:protein gp37
MALARWHTFQVLTKRPARLARMLADPAFTRKVGQAATEITGCTPQGARRMDLTGWVPCGSLDERVWMPPTHLLG